MAKPDLNNLTKHQAQVALYLDRLLDRIPADGVQFAVVASSEEVLSHIAFNTEDRAAVAKRLRDIADHFYPEES